MMSNLVSKIKFFAKLFVRKKRPFIMGDMSRTGPVSGLFGLERGVPVDRYYIEKFINDNHEYIIGDALEVGELRYLSEHGRHLRTKNILAPNAGAVSKSSQADDVYIGDLTKVETLPEGRFDSFVCTQTLNFIYDVAASIRGAHYLLKPGGRFIGTVSGISQISRFDMDRWGDYWRFTTMSLERLLGEVFGGSIKLISYGNALTSQLLLQGVAVEDVDDMKVFNEQHEDYQLLIGFVAEKQK